MFYGEDRLGFFHIKYKLKLHITIEIKLCLTMNQSFNDLFCLEKSKKQDVFFNKVLKSPYTEVRPPLKGCLF